MIYTFELTADVYRKDIGIYVIVYKHDFSPL